MSLNTFLNKFKHVFHLPVHQEEASCQLLYLRQGKTSVAEHAIQFWVFAAKTDWDEATLWRTFHNSLSETIKDQLAIRDEPKSLDELIVLAIKIDNRIQDQHGWANPQFCVSQ